MCAHPTALLLAMLSNMMQKNRDLNAWLLAATERLNIAPYKNHVEASMTKTTWRVFLAGSGTPRVTIRQCRHVEAYVPLAGGILFSLFERFRPTELATATAVEGEVSDLP